MTALLNFATTACYISYKILQLQEHIQASNFQVTSGMALDSLVCKYFTHINRISVHNVMQQALHTNVVSTGVFPTVPYMDREFQHTWQSNAVPCIWELLPSLKADIMGIEVINNKSKNLCI